MVDIASSGLEQGFSAQYPVKARIGPYNITKKLGSGFSATIRLAHTDDGTSYALKIFDLRKEGNDEKFLKLIQEEVQATIGLKNKHIVKYYEYQEKAEYVKLSNGEKYDVAYIAQEPIMGGELFAHVYHTGVFSEEICRYFFKQILVGLHYMHKSGISHRDLKPENIVLDHKGDTKIVDFGFAARLEGRDGSGFNRTFKGTMAYMAPEIIERKPYQGDAVDLFALGCILFVMRSGAMPFDQMARGEDSIYRFFMMNRIDKYWQTHTQDKEEGYFSEDFKDLVTSMLHYHPQHRPMIADIIGHPWLAGETATAEQVQAEFTQRLVEVNKRVKEEQDQEKAVKNRNRRSEVINGVRYVWGELTELDKNDDKHKVIQLKMNPYDAKMKKNTCFFSDVYPDVVFKKIEEALIENGRLGDTKETKIGQFSDLTIHHKKWRMVYTMTKKLAPKELTPIPDMEDLGIVEEQKESSEVEAPEERSEIQIEILDAGDSTNKDNVGWVCVEFTRKSGSSTLFYEQWQYLEDKLSTCNTVRM